jgi:hypothetical protein
VSNGRAPGLYPGDRGSSPRELSTLAPPKLSRMSSDPLRRRSTVRIGPAGPLHLLRWRSRSARRSDPAKDGRSSRPRRPTGRRSLTGGRRRGPSRQASRTRGVVAEHATPSRWRSPVRIRSGPPLGADGREIAVAYGPLRWGVAESARQAALTRRSQVRALAPQPSDRHPSRPHGSTDRARGFDPRE